MLMLPKFTKLAAAAIVLAVVGAACASAAQPSDSQGLGPVAAAPAPTDPILGNTASPPAPSPEPVVGKTPVPNLLETADVDEELERARFSTRGWRTDFSKRTVPLSDIFSGGPGKDGIPSIDNPQFESVENADKWLGELEPVQVVEINGEVKAYPVGILIWHEIVNDTVGGVPIAVTYCPLCNTALTFDRRVGDRVLDFGVSGNLRFSDLIMYDRQTETWWQQLEGIGIIGELAGVELTFIPSPLVSWGDFKLANPDARVLSRDTGFSRSYGQNPYTGYDTGIPFLFFGEDDDRLNQLDRIVAISDGDEAVAVPFKVLRKEPVVSLTLNERELVVFFKPGTASALDSFDIARSRDVGATNVFTPTVNGQKLTFRSTEDGFVDNETGTLWNLLGQGLSGELQGAQLEQVVHGNHFWFSWAVFKPDTVIYTGAQK